MLHTEPRCRMTSWCLRRYSDRVWRMMLGMEWCLAGVCIWAQSFTISSFLRLRYIRVGCNLGSFRYHLGGLGQRLRRVRYLVNLKFGLQLGRSWLAATSSCSQTAVWNTDAQVADVALALVSVWWVCCGHYSHGFLGDDLEHRSWYRMADVVALRPVRY